MKFNIGFIPTLLLLIPVIFACFKTPADKPELEDENIIVFIAKCVGRFGCIGYMCLAIGDYEVGFSSKLLFLIWAVVALLVIALYWVLWIRQYKKGNHFEDIYGTGIPLFIIPQTRLTQKKMRTENNTALSNIFFKRGNKKWRVIIFVME